MEGMHPRCIAIAGTFGRWAKGEPVARGKGVCFDTLLEIDFEHMDPVTLSQDTCVKVKVKKMNVR
jgi:molybdopterin-containing oxidoreductase family molybdopterin binding subunit